MKLSKVLSLVLAIAMLFSMPTFAAFTDVAADANYAEAVTVLSALEIINGYEDGSFKPEGKITRAEYAAIVCRVNNLDDAAKANSVGGIFTDVAADHWASGYIATAYQAGIVNGMGDGTFAPEAEVTYEQAVKMLVAALGYELKAQTMGGYPTGYMMIANQESITVGTTNTAGGASRATVARLTYNALTVPLMEQYTWGTDEYIAPQNNKSILYTKLNVVKAEATINTVPLNKDAKDVTLTNVEYDKVAKNNGYANTASTTAKINGVDLAGYQGLKATVLMDVSEDGVKKLVCVVAKAGKNAEITVDPTMMSEVNTADNYVEYFKSADDSDPTKIKVETTLNTYKNLVAGTYATDVIPGGNAGDLAYRFVDTDNNGTYDTVFVDNVVVFVVGNVNVANGKIYRDSSASVKTIGASVPATIELDEENDNLSWTITDVDGNAMELADIKAGDVVAVATSGTTTKVYEIIVCGDKVEGSVAQTFAETKKVGIGNWNKFTIGDADYMMADNTVAVQPGDSIIATVFGDKVVAYEIAEGIKNYGMIIATNVDTNFGTTNQLQILTQKGEIVTVNLAEKVNGVAYAGTLATDFPKGDLIAYELNAKGELKEYDSETANGANVLKSTDGINTGASMVYKASSEKLGSYYITDNTVIFTTETDRAPYATPAPSATPVPEISKTNVALASRDVFVDGETYPKAHVIYNEDKEALVVALIENANVVSMDAFPIVVTKVSTVSVENENRTKLFGYVNGEEVELIVASNADASATLAIGDIAMYTTNGAGEIVKAIKLAYKDGSGNYVVYDNAISSTPAPDDAKTAIAGHNVTLYTADYNAGPSATPAATVAGTLMSKGSVRSEAALKGFGVAGKLYSAAGKNFRILNADNYALTFGATRNYDNGGIVDGYISDYSVNSNAVAYKYNAKNGKFTVTTLLDAETDVNTFDKDNATQIENDDLVYAFNYDGDTKLVLIIDVKGK